jgi:uncharacterized protein
VKQDLKFGPVAGIPIGAQWSPLVIVGLNTRTSSNLASLRCQVPIEVATERIRARKGAASDADANIAAAMSAAADPWPQATGIGTAWGVDAALTQALKVVRPAGGQHHWPIRPQMEAD